MTPTLPDIDVTVPGPMAEQLNSQWGRLTYLDWCRKESDRQNACGARTYVDVDGLNCCIRRERV